MFNKSAMLAFVAALSAVAVSAIPHERDAETLRRGPVDDQFLSAHNQARAQYGARPLTQNAALVSGATMWAKTCKYQASPGAGSAYGENRYATSSPSASPAMTVDAWMREASKYNYQQPAYSPATAEFTQVVWKSTTGLACASANCPAGTVLPAASVFTVCRYSPPGNQPGQYPANVGRRV